MKCKFVQFKHASLNLHITHWNSFISLLAIFAWYTFVLMLAMDVNYKAKCVNISSPKLFAGFQLNLVHNENYCDSHFGGVIWVWMTCPSVQVNWRFEGIYRLHLQDFWSKPSNNSANLILLVIVFMRLSCIAYWTNWRRWRYAPPKRRWTAVVHRFLRRHWQTCSPMRPYAMLVPWLCLKYHK
jgi:hypothetical protein